MAYIYKITHIASGKTYIGQTCREPEVRWNEHIKYSKKATQRYDSYLYRAMRLHGLDEMQFEVIEECNVADLDEREAYWIGELNCLAPSGYNMTVGGNQPKQTDALREMARERAKDIEWKRKVSEGTKIGWHSMTDEKKKEIAMKVSLKTKGRSNWWCIGKKPNVTEETKRKISESLRGKPIIYTPEGKARHQESHSGFNSHRCNLTEETMQELLSLYDPEAKPKMKHYNDLAARFGISEVTVRRIVKGNHWYFMRDASSTGQQYHEHPAQSPTSNLE